MKTKHTKLLSAMLALLLLFSVTASSLTPAQMTQSLSQWLCANIGTAQAQGKIDSYLDWSVFALSRSECHTLDADYKAYIGSALGKNMDQLALNDYARIALAAWAVGMNARNINGTNLIDCIEKTDFSQELFTGSAAYALIALDVAESENQAARTALKSILYSAQRDDGGFNAYLKADASQYWTMDGETDSTGIVLQAIAPYKDEPQAATLIAKADAFLRNNQMSNGGFGSWGSASAESTAMVLAGLCAVGKDPDGYVKEGKSMIDALSAFVNEDGGGRNYNGSSDIMTTYQMLMGLSAYDRFKNGKEGLFEASESPFLFLKDIPVIGPVLYLIIQFIYSVFFK